MSSRCSSVTLSIFTYRLGCRVTVTKSTNLQNVNVKGDLLQSLPLRNKILQLNNKAVNDNYNTTWLNQRIIIRPVNNSFNHWPHVTIGSQLFPVMRDPALHNLTSTTRREQMTGLSSNDNWDVNSSPVSPGVNKSFFKSTFTPAYKLSSYGYQYPCTWHTQTHSD